MIEKYVNFFRAKPGCITFSPASAADIEETGAELTARGFSALPAEYERLLSLTNGIIYNGFEFYGTKPRFRGEKNYTFPDIRTVNDGYRSYKFFENKVILGNVSESMMYYDRKNGFFALADRINLRSRVETPTLEELIKIFYDHSRHVYALKK